MPELRRLLSDPAWALFLRLVEHRAEQALLGLAAHEPPDATNFRRGRYAAYVDVLTLVPTTTSLYEEYYDRTARRSTDEPILRDTGALWGNPFYSQ